MYVKQGDLFWGMGTEFVKSAMDASEKMNPGEGSELFAAGDPADHFYVLLKGNVLLSLGTTGRKVYLARHPGEIIGWSSLIGRDAYSASAKCTENCQLIKFSSQTFLDQLKENPANEAMLFQRLAEMLGNRLLEVYPSIS